jgi:DNA polymerase-1
MGLSADWGVSLKEAEETLELWYKDRPEVREWQQKTIDEAHQNGYVRTLLGRYRKLPSIFIVKSLITCLLFHTLTVA